MLLLIYFIIGIVMGGYGIFLIIEDSINDTTPYQAQDYEDEKKPYDDDDDYCWGMSKTAFDFFFWDD